jgi:hypothetical protein
MLINQQKRNGENDIQNGNVLLGWCFGLWHLYTTNDLVGERIHLQASGDLRQ